SRVGAQADRRVTIRARYFEGAIPRSLSKAIYPSGFNPRPLFRAGDTRQLVRADPDRLVSIRARSFERAILRFANPLYSKAQNRKTRESLTNGPTQ
ncbi:MAG: hypothetical protein ACYDC8_12215, partial [Gammaproteobacteria bacterium]